MLHEVKVKLYVIGSLAPFRWCNHEWTAQAKPLAFSWLSNDHLNFCSGSGDYTKISWESILLAELANTTNSKAVEWLLKIRTKDGDIRFLIFPLTHFPGSLVVKSLGYCSESHEFKSQHRQNATAGLWSQVFNPHIAQLIALSTVSHIR